MKILAIDPGTTQSGWVMYESSAVRDAGVDDNHDVLCRVQTCWKDIDLLAIEMIAGMGMAVGQETFETVRWIGRFQQAWKAPDEVRLVYRQDVKLHLCGNSRAKDPNIRQALIDRLGPQGSKKNPGPTYGVKTHAWSALAVAVTCLDLNGERNVVR